MRTQTLTQAIVLGGLLVLAGVLLLLQTYVDLSAWLWFLLLTVGGLAALAFFLADRSNLGMLITTYVLLGIALLLALVMLNVLRDEGVAVYVLSAIALPFLAVYARDRQHWWALIPAYVMLTLALMLALIGAGVLGEGLVPAYVLFAIAIPFFAVYAWDRAKWWALIPAGVMTAIGLFFVIAEAALQWLAPVLLILVGIWILARMLNQRRTHLASGDTPRETPEQDGLESDGQGDAG